MRTELQTAALIRVGRRTFPFTDCAAASEAYRATIEALGLGGSQTPHCDILDGTGRIVAHVSYNGRVWAGDRKDWSPDWKPIFDPRAT